MDLGFFEEAGTGVHRMAGARCDNKNEKSTTNLRCQGGKGWGESVLSARLDAEAEEINAVNDLIAAGGGDGEGGLLLGGGADTDRMRCHRMRNIDATTNRREAKCWGGCRLQLPRCRGGGGERRGVG